ncbi:3-dehydroquinate synthase [Paratractidigestivibacter sp.]|uniref:3-dehydroquinate synthase n=1 Tax=Paratractidigestivibacter sp. TaxID=2847316 RepID=UPI003AB16518
MSEETTETANLPLAAEPEENLAAAATQPEPVIEVPTKRQWVTLRGSSMDLRVGAGIVDGIAHDISSAIGRPRACALAVEPGAPADLVETLRRGLTDQGFQVHVFDLPAGEEAHAFSSIEKVFAGLAEAGITSDDLVVAVGHEGALSLAGASCAHWCGQVMIAEVPLDLASAITAAVTPRGLDVAGRQRMVVLDGTARFEICDLDVLLANSTEEDVLFARAMMVAAAMADSDKAVGALWDAADEVAAGDKCALVSALTECIRSRGKVVSSSSVAIRQSAEYGQTLRRALRAVLGVGEPESALLADAMRFAARLSVAGENLSIDDMFTQDELLERLGLGTVKAAVDADELVAAIQKERFARTNRFMLALPRALGRVRLTAVETETLTEHVRAWCASR